MTQLSCIFAFVSFPSLGVIIIVCLLSMLQLEDGHNNENNIMLFPPYDQQTQEHHMLTMVQELDAIYI